MGSSYCKQESGHENIDQEGRRRGVVDKRVQLTQTKTKIKRLKIENEDAESE